jgi:thiol-disulfide isomerase/thioredoxin
MDLVQQESNAPMNTPAKQTCNFCKESDFTDFSKCRFCGEKYGFAPPPAQKTYLTEKAIAVALGALVLIGIVYNVRAKSEEARRKVIASVKKDASITHRPRVFEFYADWCGPCRSYGPLIEAAKSKYPGIDFIRYDVDNPKSQAIARGLGVGAIPVTCFFDRDGAEVDQKVGTMGEDELDVHLKGLLR